MVVELNILLKDLTMKFSTNHIEHFAIFGMHFETIKLDHPPQNMRHQEEGVENMDYHALYLALGMVDILPELVTDSQMESLGKALLKKDLEPLQD